MADRRRAHLDLAELLMAVENAPPVAAAGVLGERLADTFGASRVSLLVASWWTAESRERGCSRRSPIAGRPSACSS
jgi:hypothetical protein